MVVHEFTDHAISGATLLRSGFQALMRDALSGRFDIVTLANNSFCIAGA
jgi:hypothetical protein